MPYRLTSKERQYEFSRDLKEKVKPYKYPDIFSDEQKRGLVPGEKFHDKLVEEILGRARLANDKLSSRFDTWNEIIKFLRVYIRVDDEEKQVQKNDDRKPVSIVIPTMYSTLETLCTYMSDAFFSNPLFSYKAVGPSDERKGICLEHVIGAQSMFFKHPLAMHTMWRDNFIFGFGCEGLLWEDNGVYDNTGAETYNVNDATDLLTRPTESLIQQPRVRNKIGSMSGNRMFPIDPFMALIDPNGPIHDLQQHEFFGWVDATNLNKLLKLEASMGGKVFNARYAQQAAARKAPLTSVMFDQQQRKRSGEGLEWDSAYTTAAHVIYMYIDLIPSMWGLGDGTMPQKWVFGVVGDRVLVMASPVPDRHQRYPAAICASEYDGYASTLPISRLEVMQGMQHAVNWFWNSRVINVRKAINDMFVVDPSIINIRDMENPGPGLLVRLKQPMWGKGTLDNAIKQLGVADVTQNHLTDMSVLMSLTERITGATDLRQGISSDTRERVTAKEISSRESGSYSKHEHMARIMYMQAHQDLAYLAAWQTQQYMKDEQYVRLLDRLGQDTATIFGEDRAIKVTPEDIDVPFDVMPQDGTGALGGNTQLLFDMFNLIAPDPLLRNQFDLIRIFADLARATGKKNVLDYIKNGPQVNAQVLPDEEVARQAQAGNIRELG